jgi:hypothetical protein
MKGSIDPSKDLQKIQADLRLKNKEMEELFIKQFV